MSKLWINIGAGGNILPSPWHNFDLMYRGDARIDICDPLRFADQSCRFVFAEHVVEHVSPARAWRFFKEVRRVLAPGGVFRIAVPSIERVAEFADTEYLTWLSKSGFGAATIELAVENQIINHGHQAVWSRPLLHCCFSALKFSDFLDCSPGVSPTPELRGLEGHGKVIGERNNQIETIVVEATR
jgi:SAM-dependent methyltransferase